MGGTSPDLPARFEIRSKLGAGGMGIVYRALDRARGAEVALKVLRQVTGRDVYRFKREFRALSDVVHPNLVGLYEMHTVAGDWFLTMELVDGVTFIDWLRPVVADEALGSLAQGTPRRSSPDATTPTIAAPSSSSKLGVARPRYQVIEAPLELARLEDGVYQLCDAVHALHLAGKLHRDLKPSNVLVTPGGRVVVLDFGLVSELDGDLDKTHERSQVVGTPAYMSPEQACDRPLTAASDWYSVGVMIYEALTGRRPVDVVGGSGPSFEIPLPPPERYEPRTPPALSRLTMALLAADPAGRPGGAAALAALGREPSPASRELALSHQPSPFVGREEELAGLRAALGRTRAGRGVAVFLRGLSGMGKSTLLRRFLDDLALEDASAVVLRGRCYEREWLPFKTLDTLVDALTAHLVLQPPAELERLVPPDVGPLIRLFPALRRVPVFVSSERRLLRADGTLELRRRAFAALRTLLSRVAAKVPLVLALDDVQWGDADSGSFLAELLFHPDSPPLLLVLAHRSEDEDKSALLAALTRARDSLAPSAPATAMDTERITLAPLSDREAHAFVRLAAAPASGVFGADAELLVSEAAGNPFLLSELLRTGKRGIALDEAVKARMERLPAPARALARLCAVVARPLRQSTALRAILPGDGAGLPQLCAERLLRVRRFGDDEPELETYHDRIRAAIIAGIDERERLGLHAALARVLAAEETPDPEALVAQWLGAGEPARAAVYALAAASAATERLAFHRAAELYTLALTHADLDVSARAAIETSLGHALVHTGRLDAAARAFAAAVGPTTSEAERLELERLQVEALLRGGQLEAGITLARQLLGRLGIRLPTSRPGAVAAMLRQRALTRLRGLGHEERPAAEVAPEKLQRIDILASLATGLAFPDPVLGVALSARHLREALDAGEPHRVGMAYCIELGFAATRGGRTFARTEALGARALELGRRLEDREIEGYALATMGFASHQSGRFAEANRRFAEAERILAAQGAGVRWQQNLSAFYAATAAWYQGKGRETLRLVTAYRRDAEQRGDLFALRALRGWRTNVAWLIVGQPEEARAQLAAVARPLAPGQTVQASHCYELLSGTLIDLYQGDGAAAHQRVEALWPAIEKAMLMRVQSLAIDLTFLRGKAALLDAAKREPSRRSDRIARARRCARYLDAEGMPWATGFARVLAAGALHLSDDAAGARAELEAALVTFEAAEMSLFAAAARRCLGAWCGPGSAEGAALIAAADDKMRGESIADPHAMSRLLLGLA